MRRKAVGRRRPVRNARVASTTTMKVLTLMPEAVELLPPPMKIRNITSNTLGAYRLLMSTTEKPALRGTTATNQASQGREPLSTAARVVPLVHSKAMISSQAPTARIRVPVRVSLLCRLSFERRR